MTSSTAYHKLRSLPSFAKVLIAITAIVVPFLLSSLSRSQDGEWKLEPWFFDSHDNSGSIHDLDSTNETFHHPHDNMELLFVGNSYTSVNDLAALTKQIIDSQWNANISIRSHHPGGQNFAGHVQSTRPDYAPSNPELHELRDWLVTDPKPYNWVILQEQSQIPGFWGIVTDEASSFNLSLASCQQLDKLVRQIPSAQTLLYLTWGRRNGDENNPGIYPDFLTHQLRLNEGYERYREATSTEDRPTFIAPVGMVYEAIYNDITGQGKDPLDQDSLFYNLYAEDGSHPSMAGSYLAALTMYTSMLGDDPREVKWIPEDVDPDVAKQIQSAVARTIRQTAAMGVIYPWQADLPIDENLP